MIRKCWTGKTLAKKEGKRRNAFGRKCKKLKTNKLIPEKMRKKMQPGGQGVRGKVSGFRDNRENKGNGKNSYV